MKIRKSCLHYQIWDVDTNEYKEAVRLVEDGQGELVKEDSIDYQWEIEEE